MLLVMMVLILMMITITNIILFQNNNVGTPDEAPQRELTFKKVGTIDDRSELSDEMADLCKKLPIPPPPPTPDVENEQLPAGRKYRHEHFLIVTSIQTINILHVKEFNFLVFFVMCLPLQARYTRIIP